MIHGDVFIFLKALGAREGDPLLEQALTFVGGEYDVEVFDEAGIEEKYLVAVDRGVDFLLKDGVVTTVFVYASDTEDQRTYGRWTTLVEGVGSDSTQAEIVTALGEPVGRTAAFLRYSTDAGFIQFDFEGEKLSMLVAMSEVIGHTADVADLPAATVEGAASVTGELGVFAKAVGRPMFSPEHFAVIGLAGPASDSFDDVRDGTEWQYELSPRTGVTLQFRQEILVGALIRLVAVDDEAAYPSADQLIEGLPLPASRDAIRAHFGTPDRSDQILDLYLVDDRYLRFDFVDDQSALLTVVQPGVEI